MKVQGKNYRTLWENDCGGVSIIDQTELPHHFMTRKLHTVEDIALAIRDMKVRGAPLIGVAAAYGIAIALRDDPSDRSLDEASKTLVATRPTAINLMWAVNKMRAAVKTLTLRDRPARSWTLARQIAEDDIRSCEQIGDHGLELFKKLIENKAGVSPRLELLTHCNAGWLATVDWGTALSPIYKAHEAGIPLHIWVDETRPRNQGASLTAWELGEQGIDHTVIADNTGGHLMQHGRVDACIVGSDRTSSHGDVCNKIGTYLKALAAHDNSIPFYVALPTSTIDWQVEDGIKEIPIEERGAGEVHSIRGVDAGGERHEVRLIPQRSRAANYAFDVTPSRLVTALITEKGVFDASEEGLNQLRSLL